MKTFNSTSRVTDIDIDVTESTVILYNNQTQQPLSTTDINDIETSLAINYPHLLDSNTCNVVVIDNNQQLNTLAG